MIWYVKVEGNEELTEEEIITELEALGLKPGVFKRALM